jgi:hypothetical protein
MISKTDSFYHGLKVIDWDIFLTLKFKRHKIDNYIDNNFRKKSLEELMISLQRSLNQHPTCIKPNDIIYFASEEMNLDALYHIHTLIHVKRKSGVDPEVVRKRLVDLVAQTRDHDDRKVYVTPRRVKDTGREDKVYKHCELVRSSRKVNWYINKVQGNYDAGKRIFFNKMDMGKSSPFFIFYRWVLKQKGLN